MNAKLLKNYLLLHLIVVIFGFTAIFGKLISLDSGVLVWYRMLIAVFGIAVYFRLTGRSFRLPIKMVVKTLLVGLLVAGHWVCFFESIKRSNVSIGLVCLSLAPFFISFLEPLLFPRRYRAYEGILGVMTVIGMAGIYSFESQYVSGIIVGILAVSLSSLFTVINARLVRNHDSSIISFYELIGGWAGLCIYLFAIRGVEVSELALNWEDSIYLLILGLICTSFAFIGSVHVMKVITPFTTMLIINLEPVYGIGLALVIFGETEFMSWGFYLGAAAILGSIVVNAMLARKRAPMAPSNLNEKDDIQ
ncbi:MAG: EamA family transporter [Candidatus Hydrogenedentota bacterium]